MSKTNIEPGLNIYLIVGIVAVIICFCISSIIGYYIVSRPAEDIGIPGKIGNRCLSNGTCSDPNSICRFDKCYEQCKGRNAWPCENDGDIPMTKTYWCDYKDCPAYVTPEAKEAADNQKAPDVFGEAVKEIARIDKLKEERIAKEKEEAAAEAAQAKITAAANAASQGNYCACIPVLEVKTHSFGDGCNIIANGYDGSNAHKWCYVKGGTQCKEATQSREGDRGRAWRLCD